MNRLLKSTKSQIQLAFLVASIGMAQIAFNIAYAQEAVGVNEPSVGVGYQYLPCRFSWDALKLPNGEVKNFTTSAKRQPYQGPCLAFATAGALESLYEIDNNLPDANIDLSEAHLDYSYYPATSYPVSSNHEFPTEACGNFAPDCTDEEDCKFWSDVRVLLTGYHSCFLIEKNLDREQGEPVTYKIESKVDEGIDWYGIHSFNTLTITSEADLKLSVMNNGPLVMKVSGVSALNEFRSYPGTDWTGFSYHAYLVIGWKNTASGTSWYLKDPWKGDFIYSKPAPNVTSSAMTFYELQGAYATQHPTRPNRVAFNPEDQCPAPPNPNPDITPQITTLVTDPAINTGIWYTLNATTACNTGIVEYEYSIPSSQVQTQVDNNCTSSIRFKLNNSYSSNNITIRVRAKTTHGQWSPWFSRTVLVNDMM